MRKLVRSLLLVMLLVGMTSGVAWATNLLTNGSFESPAQSERQIFALPANWALRDLGGYYAYGPDPGQITPEDGSQYLVIRSEEVLQTTSTQFVEGSTYTMSAFASSWDGLAWGVGIMLYAADTPGATELGTYLNWAGGAAPVLADGWLEFDVSWTATAAEAGKYVQAVLLSDQWPNETVWFDNVVVTPEPATLALLATGFVLLKRKRA